RAQLEGIFEGSEDVLDAAQTALIRLSSLLSEQNVDEVSQTLANVRDLTERLSAEEALIDDMRTAVGRMDQAAQDISLAANSMQSFAVTAESFLNEELTTAVNQTGQAALSVDLAARNTNQFMMTITPAAEAFAQDGLENLNRASADMRQLAATLERIASEIEHNPGGFVAGSPRETVEVPQ
ncbi:MAG: hypothetical protein NXI03_03605, partial [Alphaproteobacteria bacterium]|nr:hypothetical protein [Alphaproteobacteria bacterium]